MGENLRRKNGGYNEHQRQAQAKEADREDKGSRQDASDRAEIQRGEITGEGRRLPFRYKIDDLGCKINIFRSKNVCYNIICIF